MKCSIVVPGSTALNGLRGLAAFHIMIFHYISESEELAAAAVEVNLNGSLQMPLFFLLSGFSLALAYGKTEWNVKCCCCCGQNQEEEKELPSFKSWDFYRNRFARIGPLYYLTSLLAYPLWLLGKNEMFDSHVEMITRIIATVTCTGSWFFPAETWPANPVSWTVNTLFFFYLVFPCILPRVQRMSDRLLSRWIVILFYIQVLPFALLFIGFLLSGREGMIDRLYWPVTANPISRLPVFLMGVLAGIQRIRQVKNNEENDFNESQIFLHDILPWGVIWSTKSIEDMKTRSCEEVEKIWKRRVDMNSAIIILFIFGFCVYTTFFDGDFNYHGQLVVVHMQLVVIVGLTKDGGKSTIARICNTKILQGSYRIRL